LPGFLAAHAEGAPQRFGELAADGEHRVQVAHGFLRDVGDLLPAHGAVLAAAAGHQVDAFEVDGPGDHAPPVGSRPSTEKEVWDLPEPDSPIRPCTSPRRMRRSTPWTTRARLPSLWS